MTQTERPLKDKALAYILWCGCFLGLCGLHRFYMGKWVTGLIWLLTGGLLLVGQILDLFFVGRTIERINRGV